MLDPARHLALAQDLPVCFPGRQCVQTPPLTADLISATSALTPASSAIAAGCFVALGASLVLAGTGLRLQWRGPGVRPWLVVLAAALLLVGTVITYTISGWFGTILSIYSDLHEQPSAPAPASLNGSWHSVLFAGQAMVVLAAVTFFLILNTAAVRRRRGVEA